MKERNSIRNRVRKRIPFCTTIFSVLLFININIFADFDPDKFENILNNIDAMEKEGEEEMKKGKAKKSLKFSEPVMCGINSCKVSS